MSARSFAKLTSRPIVIGTHPRSGTHLTIDLCRKQFPDCRSWKWPGENLSRLYLSLESLFVPGTFHTSLTKAINILRRVKRPLIKTHFHLDDLCAGRIEGLTKAAPGLVEYLNENADFYHVYRDGRSVMMSYQLLCQRIDPSSRCDTSTFIRQKEEGLSRPAFWANAVRRALCMQNVTCIRFEDVVRQTRQVVDTFAEVSGMRAEYREPLLPAQLKNFWVGRWNRLVARCPASTAIIGRDRFDAVRKWPEAFTADDRKFFHDEAGDLLIELGYESDDSWVDVSSES